MTLLTVIGFIGYKVATKISNKKEISERIKTIPNFTFHTLDGMEFTRNNLGNKTIIFIYINSECDYCQSEAIKIQKRLPDFEDAQLIFVSFETAEDIQKFAKDYKLDNQENILFLEDRKGKFSEVFDVSSIPYIVIYDKDKNFLKKFKGATKIDKILEVLK